MSVFTKEDMAGLFKRWYKPLRQWIYNKRGTATINSEVAEDIAQEVFLRLLKYRKEDSEPIEKIQGYLFRIADNVRNEWLQRAQQRKGHDPDWLDDLIDEGAEPATETATEDEHELIRRCVDQLPARGAKILLLHINEGLTYKQIAEREGITYRMVLRILTRAYSYMREVLAREQATLPISQELKHRRVQEAVRLHRRQNRLKAAAPVNAGTVRRALETERFVIAAAGRRLGISESQMLIKARKLLPDFEQRRKEVREQVARERREFRANALLTALQQNQFNIAATARAIDKSIAWVHRYVRDLLPDFDRLRADYFAEHSLGRCGAHIETEEEHAERLLRASQARSRTAIMVNSRRWANTEEREAQKREKLRDLEAQLEAMNATHRAEKAAMHKAMQALLREQKQTRARQVKERGALNTAITHARIAIPGYRESLNLAEVRRQREAEKMRRNRDALDRTNGDHNKAAQLLGMHPSHLRKWKKAYWQPVPVRNHEEGYEQTAAPAC